MKIYISCVHACNANCTTNYHSPLGNVHTYIPNIMNYSIFYTLICHMVNMKYLLVYLAREENKCSLCILS